MISYSAARTMKTMKIRLLLLSLGMIMGLSYEAFAKRQLVLEQKTAEIIKLESGVSEIFVADPEIADIQLNSPTVAYVYGKRTGSTTIFASNKEGKTILEMDVQVVHNLTPLKSAINNAYPNENVKIVSAPYGIILEGDVSSPQASKDIVNIAQRYLTDKENVLNNMKITMPTQVYLSVKVAEVKRAVLNQLDINWAATANIGSFTFGVLTGRAPVDVGNNFIRNAATQQLNSVGFRGTSGSSVNINALLDALNREGLSTVLAEPNLVAVSGETASFLVGGEFPYPVPQERTITIQFKEFGISLRFTPTVISQRLINLRVRPEVSELDPSTQLNIPVAGLANLSVPGISTRKAETSVELGSGDSMVLAGLYSKKMSNVIRELPGLGDIPVLGALFRSTQFQRDETELVIIVTPYLVKPVSRHSLQKPTDNLRFASQLEMILFNRLNSYDHNRDPTVYCDPMLCETAATVTEASAASTDGVIFEKPLTAIVEGESPVDQKVEQDRQALRRENQSDSSVSLIGDAGFYTE